MFEENNENNQNSSNEDILNNILKTDHRKVVENIFDSPKEKVVIFKKTTLLQKIIISLSGFFLVALFVLLFVFVKFNKTIDTQVINADYSNKIVLNINSPEGVNDNGQIEYFLSFKNTEEYIMKNIELSVRFPSEFVFLSSSLENSFINSEYIKWNFDVINPGEEKNISIKGNLFGAIGVESVLIASMNYEFDTISSVFSSNSSYKTTINKSVFDIVFERDDIFFKDKEIVYKIKIKNNSEKALKNLKVSLNYPEYFKIKEYSENPFKVYENEQVYWVFDLNKKQIEKTDESKDDYYEKIITIKGVVDSDSINEINFTVYAGIVEDMGFVDDSSYTFYKDDLIRTSSSGLNFVINTDSKISDENGNRFAIANINNPYKISFKYNKTNKDLSFKDLRLVVELLGDDFIDSKIKFNISPVFTDTIVDGLSNYVIEWNKTNNNYFKDISESERELNMILSFKKNLLNKYKEGGYNTNIKITLFGKVNSGKEIILVDNKIFKLILDSDMVVKTNTSKVNLKVNKESNPIEISISLSNHYNNLSGTAVYFTLPEGVEYTSDSILTKSSKFDYDVSAKKISWIVGDVGAFEKEIVGKFYLKVVPNNKFIDKNMPLTSDINVVYMDTTIKSDFSLNIKPILSVNKVSK